MSDGARTEEARQATGSRLREALIAASSWLDVHAERVDALNVFPVPDGDTGTNMSLTLRAAAEALHKLPETAAVGEVAKAAYQASMMGARGNSGVILSQLLRGFAHALEGKQVMSSADLATALAEASAVAYRGVSRPVEGTILTVARKTGEAAQAAAHLQQDLRNVLEHALRAAGDAVANTPNQLEVLRKAGVVDSGGEGLRVLIEGAWMWSTGRAMERSAQAVTVRAQLDQLEHDPQEMFGFCTEFLLQGCQIPADDVKAAMEALGQSVLAVGDSELLRVHVHTRRPGQALEFAVEHGTLARVKVENMELQHAEFAAAGRTGHTRAPEAQDGVGVIAVASGAGLRGVFESLGARVVEGGQSMNPSVQDILEAVQRSVYSQVIVLPNNSNIALTARHAAELSTLPVRVLPTASVAQGIGALLAYNFQADLDANADAMTHAASAVHTVEITRAVRDAEVDGLPVKCGQVLGILDGTVVTAGASPLQAALSALAHSTLTAMELVTIYTGEGVADAEAQELAAAIRGSHPALQVDVVEGGQPHYPFILAIE